MHGGESRVHVDNNLIAYLCGAGHKSQIVRCWCEFKAHHLLEFIVAFCQKSVCELNSFLR